MTKLNPLNKGPSTLFLIFTDILWDMTISNTSPISNHSGKKIRLRSTLHFAAIWIIGHMYW